MGKICAQGLLLRTVVTAWRLFARLVSLQGVCTVGAFSCKSRAKRWKLRTYYCRNSCNWRVFRISEMRSVFQVSSLFWRRILLQVVVVYWVTVDSGFVARWTVSSAANGCYWQFCSLFFARRARRCLTEFQVSQQSICIISNSVT